MEQIRLTNESDLQTLLAGAKDDFANGKNAAVSWLYATAAQSRFPEENVFGIYLSRPGFAWMALWMAVTDRSKLRKRHLGYVRPRGSDHVGRVTIGGANQSIEHPRGLLVSDARLYLFRRIQLPEPSHEIPDHLDSAARAEWLTDRGFAWQDIERRGQMRRALVAPTTMPPSVIAIDAWQTAVIGVPTLVPFLEATIADSLLDQLATRIDFSPNAPGRDYLKKER